MLPEATQWTELVNVGGSGEDTSAVKAPPAAQKANPSFLCSSFLLRGTRTESFCFPEVSDLKQRLQTSVTDADLPLGAPSQQ